MEKTIVIDFHAHILPEMDHGCRNVETALTQLHMAKEAGVDVVVATSHFYPHVESAEAFLERREHAARLLWDAMEKSTLSLPKVVLGAEVLICPGLERLECLREFCVEGTDVLLLEMPLTEKWDEALIQTAEAIGSRRDIKIVYAHVERYPKAQVKRLVGRDFKAQINASSFFGRKYFCAKYYLKQDMVYALGSDVHGVSREYALFERILKKYAEKCRMIMERTGKLMQYPEEG